MAFSMMFSSTITPIKATSTLDSNAYTIMSLDDNNQSEENNESDLEESDGKLETSFDFEEDIEDSSEEKIIYSQQSLTADIYADNSFGKDLDYQIKIKGTFPEDASIKAYIKANNEKSSDREDILSFAYEIFDKDGNVIEEDSSQTFEIEIKSDEISPDDQYFLYENNRYKTINKFNLLDGSITFYSKAKRFILERNKPKDLDSKELKLADDFDEELTYQDLYAEIYKDKSYEKKAYDPTKIKLNGLLPAGARVKAYPVEIKIEGQEVLAAYDITVFDKDGKDYKVGPDNNIRVKITNKKIKKAKKVDVYHKENEFAPEERIDNKTKTDDTVAFKADNFSIYAVTDPEAQATRTYKFYVRNADGSLKLINTQTIRSGEMLQKPPVPILNDRGRYAGWFPIGESKQEHGDNEVHFFTPITFDTKTPVTIEAEPLFLDNAYIDFKERVYITEQNKKDFPIPAGYILSDDGFYRNNQGEKLYRDEVYKTRVQDFDKSIGEVHIPIIKDEALTNPDQASPVLSYWSIDPEGGEIFDFSKPITRDLIRRQEQISGENQLVRLDLFAIYELGYTVSFDSQGGSHVTRQIVKKGESLNTDKIIDPIKPGYVFKGWSLTPGGKIINLENRIITQSKTLYAIYDKLPGTYTVSHYTENINDTGFTFYNIETIVEKVGNYTKDGEYFTNPANSKIAKDLIEKGYTVPKSVTPPDKAALVKADGSTNIKVYYRRPRYNLTVFSTGLFQGVPTRQFIVQYKEGEDTKDTWDRMGQKLGRYVVREDSLDGPVMKVPPKMPAHDLSLYFLPTRGNEEWYTKYIEVDENDKPILDAYGNPKVLRKEAHNAIIAGVETYKGGGNLEGFTFRYVTEPGNDKDSPKVYTIGEAKEVRTYYRRNNYKLTFKTNNNNFKDKLLSLAYETNINSYVPTDIKIGMVDKEGSVFKGWYDNPEFTRIPLDFSNLTMPAKDTTYFGKWEQEKYTVRIYREMTTPGQSVGPGKMEEIQVDRNKKLSQSDSRLWANKPEKIKDETDVKMTWYRFSGSQFEPYDFNEPITESIFLYPVWSYFDPVSNSYRPLEDIHRITYTDGKNSFVDKNLYLNNAAAILQPPYLLDNVSQLDDPKNLDDKYFGDFVAPDGKHFQGWILNNDPSRIYRPGEVVNVTGDMTFYAKWGEMDKTQITLYEQKPGTDKSLSKTETIRENGTVVLPSPTLQNYNFLGWSKIPNGNVDFKAGQEVMVTSENVQNELFGIWDVNRTIVINENQPDGSDNTYSRENIANGTIKLIKPAEIKGYRFLGWATEEGAKIPEYDPEAELKVDDNTPLPEKLYGVWQKTQQLTFHNTNKDYNTTSAKADDVTIKVTYQLNGEKISYNEKELKINHDQSVTIDLPIEASDVEYQVIPNDYYKLIKVTPEKLGGRLGDHYGDGVDNISVEIVVARKRLTYDSNIESIYFDGIEYENGGTIIDASYTKTLDKDALNNHHTDSFYIKDKMPKGFKFLGWSSTSDGKNMVAYSNNTLLQDIKEERLYAIWSRPKKFEFVIEKDDPTDKTEINFTVELDNYYYDKKTFKSNSEEILNTPTASNIKNIIVNNDDYQYEIIGPEVTTDDVKFDKYTYIIKIKNNPPVPTGLTDNIAPMAIMLALASMAIAYRLYRKNKLAGGIDE